MHSIHYNNGEYEQILQQLDQLLRQLDHSEASDLPALTTSILQYFDLVHREPLARLHQLAQDRYPDLLTEIGQDYTVTTLLQLYDLLPGEVERDPLHSTGTVGFVPFDKVGLLSKEVPDP